MTVAYCTVVYQNSTQQTDTIILSVVWVHLHFIQKFQATSYTDWCVLLLFLALPSKFCFKFSKYGATNFLQVYTRSLFISMSTFHPTFTFESSQFRKFKIHSLLSSYFSCTVGLITFIVLLGQWLAFIWQKSAQNTTIRLLKCLVRRNLSRLTPCLCLCYSMG